MSIFQIGIIFWIIWFFFVMPVYAPSFYAGCKCGTLTGGSTPTTSPRWCRSYWRRGSNPSSFHEQFLPASEAAFPRGRMDCHSSALPPALLPLFGWPEKAPPIHSTDQFPSTGLFQNTDDAHVILDLSSIIGNSRAELNMVVLHEVIYDPQLQVGLLKLRFLQLATASPSR